MRTRWAACTLALLACRGLSAQEASNGPVSIFLRLPTAADEAASEKVDAAERQIRRLLGPDATREMTLGPEMRFRASAWSADLPLPERRAMLGSLTAAWSKDIRIEEGGSSMETRPEEPHAFLRSKSALQLFPDGLLGGAFGRAYDGARDSGIAAVPVAGLVPAPKRSNPFEEEIQAAAKEEGLDPDVLRAVAAAKSGFRPTVISGGAYGLMAISPRTLKTLGFSQDDILDPKTNLKAGARLLAALLKQFDGDIHRALAAYQVGAPAVRRSGGIPNDRNVQDFLASYELAFRTGGVVKPSASTARRPVKPVDPVTEIERRCRHSGSVACYRPLIEISAGKAGIDAPLMEAMVMKEDPQADPEAVSPMGAIGLGQLMPDTARLLGVSDPTSPRQNLRGMAKHFKYLLERYDGDFVLAVAAYNAGEGNVKSKIPRFRETMDYVRAVFANYRALTGIVVEVESYMSAPRHVRLASK